MRLQYPRGRRGARSSMFWLSSSRRRSERWVFVPGLSHFLLYKDELSNATDILDRNLGVIDIVAAIGMQFCFPLCKVVCLQLGGQYSKDLYQFDAAVNRKIPSIHFSILRQDDRIEVMMRGEALGEKNINSFQFVLVAIGIFSIAPL